MPRGGARKGAGKPKGRKSLKTLVTAQRILRDAELTAENTIEAIRRGMSADIGDLFDAAGKLKPLHELTEAQRWNISGVEVIIKNAEAGDGHTDTVHKVRWTDRSKYVEMAAKYHALLTERVDLNVNVGEHLDKARQRAAERNASHRS